MPIYEFLCKTCKKPFEVMRPMSATDDPACPECGGAEVSRKLSLFFSGTAGAKPNGGGGGGSCCSGGGCACH
jgi:putative FmdB family regulatory protein